MQFDILWPRSSPCWASTSKPARSKPGGGDDSAAASRAAASLAATRLDPAPPASTSAPEGGSDHAIAGRTPCEDRRRTSSIESRRNAR